MTKDYLRQMKSLPDLLNVKHTKFCFDKLPQINKTSLELENSRRIMQGGEGNKNNTAKPEINI